MLSKSKFIQKRWLDFRNGHSVYLSFVLTFVNFILITYNFAVKKYDFFQGFIDNLFVFTLIFIAIYIPAAILIGYWHRRHQWTIENEAMLQENWVWAWIARYQIRLIEGKVTPEESQSVISYLDSIIKRQKKDGFFNAKVDNKTQMNDKTL
ncbi:MAG: hypothetical protein E6K88_09190 [Thaumarchaeota archaeon]|nr:MAG: hypothetical protein E6K92_08620 [Nitrososphaerota archaeon]TLY05836.1 MAG: hypothetical protein E6K88_09190 [Nitrososphaerota archaeon]